MLSDKKKFLSIIIFASVLLTVIGTFVSISYGAKVINIFEAIKKNSSDFEIIKNIRLPRTFSAIVLGSLIATSGGIIQGITKNPISSPSILGINQSAIFAVSLSFLFKNPFGTNSKIIFSFIGSFLGAFLIFFLSQVKNKINITRLILAGTSLGLLFISLASSIALLTNNSKYLATWTAGSISGTTWESVKLLIIFGAPALVFANLLSSKIDILNLSDEVAISLGENPNKIRIQGFIIISILTGVSVSIGGNISFLCLIVPNILKNLLGLNYKKIIFGSAFLGSVILLFSDVIARALAAPYESPVGAITSLIGAPFLVYLIRRNSK